MNIWSTKTAEDCMLLSDENRPGLIRLHYNSKSNDSRDREEDNAVTNHAENPWMTYLLQSYLSRPKRKMIQTPTLLPITVCQRYVMLWEALWTPWHHSNGSISRWRGVKEVRWNRDLSEPSAWGAILVKAAEVPKLIVTSRY